MRYWLSFFVVAVGCASEPAVLTPQPTHALTPRPSHKLTPKPTYTKKHPTDEMMRMRKVKAHLHSLLERLKGYGRESEVASDRLVRLGVEALAAVKADWEDSLLRGEDVWEALRRLEAVYVGDVGVAQSSAEEALKKRAVGVDVKGGEARLAAVASALAELNGVGAVLTPPAAEKARLWDGPFSTPDRATVKEVFEALAESAGLSVVWRFGSAVLCTNPQKAAFSEVFDLSIPEDVWKALATRLPAYGWEGPVDALLRKMRDASGVRWELAADRAIGKCGVQVMVPAGTLWEQMGVVALSVGGRWTWRAGALVLARGALEVDTQLRAENSKNWRKNRLALPKLMDAWRRIRGER